MCLYVLHVFGCVCICVCMVDFVLVYVFFSFMCTHFIQSVHGSDKTCLFYASTFSWFLGIVSCVCLCVELHWKIIHILWMYSAYMYMYTRICTVMLPCTWPHNVLDMVWTNCLCQISSTRLMNCLKILISSPPKTFTYRLYTEAPSSF